MASIIRLAPQILAGSAVVGFGFAFSRDTLSSDQEIFAFHFDSCCSGILSVWTLYFECLDGAELSDLA